MLHSRLVSTVGALVLGLAGMLVSKANYKPDYPNSLYFTFGPDSPCRLVAYGLGNSLFTTSEVGESEVFHQVKFYTVSGVCLVTIWATESCSLKKVYFR
jgi:hypothetical protein